MVPYLHHGVLDHVRSPRRGEHVQFSQRSGVKGIVLLQDPRLLHRLVRQLESVEPDL
jgi:hypothetical protein